MYILVPSPHYEPFKATPLVLGCLDGPKREPKRCKNNRKRDNPPSTGRKNMLMSWFWSRKRGVATNCTATRTKRGAAMNSPLQHTFLSLVMQRRYQDTVSLRSRLQFQAAIIRRARRPRRSSGHRWEHESEGFPAVPGWTSEAPWNQPSCGRLKSKAGQEETTSYPQQLKQPGIYFGTISFWYFQYQMILPIDRQIHFLGPCILYNAEVFVYYRILGV